MWEQVEGDEKTLVSHSNTNEMFNNVLPWESMYLLVSDSVGQLGDGKRCSEATAGLDH